MSYSMEIDARVKAQRQKGGNRRGKASVTKRKVARDIRFGRVEPVLVSGVVELVKTGAQDWRLAPARYAVKRNAARRISL